MRVRIFILVLVIFVLLAGGIYYIFAGLEPKKKTSNFISINDTPTSLNAEQTTNTSNTLSTEVLDNATEIFNTSNQNIQAIEANRTEENVAENNKTEQEIKQEESKEETSQESQQEQAPQVISIRKDYEELLKGSKQDKSLGEPRYRVFLIGDAKLSKLERKTINEITRTLSIRGGYAHYALFVEQLEGGNLRLALFNEDLLDEENFISLKGPLQMLWFKLNQSSMQSIKNSFLIKDFKAQLPKDTKFRYIILSGFTDELGSKEHNYMLGLKRGASVASEFMRQSAKIILISYGKDRPLTDKEEEKYRYKNRRVEAIINSF